MTGDECFLSKEAKSKIIKSLKNFIYQSSFTDTVIFINVSGEYRTLYSFSLCDSAKEIDFKLYKVDEIKDLEIKSYEINDRKEFIIKFGLFYLFISKISDNNTDDEFIIKFLIDELLAIL